MRFDYRWPLMIVVLCGCSARAQKGLNSIYSAYGIGDYRLREQNSFLGMGNVGVAMPSEGSLNEMNPASFGWLPKNKFMFEFTLGGISTKYITDNVNIPAGDFTISRIALGLQLVKPLWTVVGLKKLSSVDYFTTSTHEIAGTTQSYPSTIEGTGGIYEVYAANSLKLMKNLSFGVTTGFLFGSINEKETIGSGTDALISDKNKNYNHLSLNTGLQYLFRKGKNVVMIGAFYEPQIALNVLEQNALETSTAAVLVSGNDLSYKFSFPKKYGLGLTFKRDAFTVSADAIMQPWSSTGYKGSSFTTTDASSYSIGIRHQPVKKGVWGMTQGIGLYAGANLENSYLILDGYRLNTKSFTLGASFPSKNTLNMYTAGVRIGTRGEAVYPLVKENFFEFNFTFSFGSYFLKGPRYD